MLFSKILVTSMASAAVGQGLTQVFAAHPSLSNLTTYLNLYPDILNNLNSLSNITLLAPSNMAFQTALNSSTSAIFSAGAADAISALLSYHVLNGTYASLDIIPDFVDTLLMPGLYANVTGGQVVEVIPSSNMSNATVTFYSGLLQNTPVAGNATFNVTNGVVHIVDSFLEIPSNLTNTAVQLDLRSAVGALEAANLDEQTDTMMDMTFFVPTNAAFQAVGSTLATSSPQELLRILRYHMLNGTVGYSSMLKNGSTFLTADDIPISITRQEGGLFVNGARVVTPDVLIANGVIHVIDGVLNPGNRTASAQLTASTGEPAFSGATSASDAPFTNGVPSATTSVNTAGPASAASAATSGSGTGSVSSSSSSAAAIPLKTGAIGAAALFGGLAALINS